MLVKYNFPLIKNVSDVAPAIAGADEFDIFCRDDVLVANYVVRFADTFPEVRTTNDAIRRECRGMLFDPENGDIIRRPFHKFFNVNEINETQEQYIDTNDDHVIIEKLDGSMFSPFRINDNVYWGTKMGITEVSDSARRFVNEHQKYNLFSQELLGEYTPIFEWCSRSLRIVIDHPDDKLVLTGIRHLYTGEYMQYNEMCRVAAQHDIPVVGIYDSVTDLHKFITYAKGLDQTEGFVMRFNDGHMLKFKCQWYLNIHRLKDMINNERKVVNLILTNKLDDVKAFLDSNQVADLEKYEYDFGDTLVKESHFMKNTIDDIRNTYEDRKDFSLNGNPDQYGSIQKSQIYQFFDSGVNFDTYISKIKSILLRDMSNNTFRNIKHELFSNIEFHVR